jgi:chromatin segregation and condensation protein Rec8/ScpA/Scc1 (kleisin family)
VGCRLENINQIKIPNRFAALENLSVDEDINRTWESIKENIKISAKERVSKKQKFCLEKPRKSQWVSRYIAVLFL